MQDSDQDIQPTRSDLSSSSDPIDFNKCFGQLLRHARKDRGWSQKDLANKLTDMAPDNAVSQQAVGHWEQGRMLPKKDKWLILEQLFSENSELIQFVKNNQPTDYKRRSSIITYMASEPDHHRQNLPLPLRTASKLLVELESCLPTRYQKHLHWPFLENERRSAATYVSDKLALEVKRMPSPRWDERDIYASLFNLLKLKKSLPESGPHPDAYILMLIGPSPENLSLHHKVYRDAALFDIVVEYRSDIDGVVESIKTVEEYGVDSLWEPDPDRLHDDY